MKINNIRASIEAHKQNHESKVFEKTRYGKKIRALKDVHKGGSCFVVGNGPSLKVADLEKICDLGVPCFATNRIFKLFDKTEWRPAYYVSEDILLMKDAQEIIRNMPVKKRFIPINLKWYEGIDIPNADYFYIEYTDPMKNTFGLSTEIDHCIRCRGTVTITCIQIAIYMGFSKIYLIGVDHNFAKMFDKNGNVIIDNTIKNHFVEDYDKGIVDQGFHVDNATEAYQDVERLSQRMNTFRIYNATRGGKLEVFERVDFNSVIDELHNI